MSAISGYFVFNSPTTDPNILQRMSNALATHGPEAERTWQSGQIGLVQRLMRTTPEDLFDQQPVLAAEGNVALIADARIDNRDELANAFGWNAAQVRCLPDSRFAMEAWLRWKEMCGRRLVGCYCIAVWDNHERSLTLIRDAVGERAVHYFHNSKFFAFATMPKGLFAIPEVPRELNEEKLADFLVLNNRDHKTTHYKNIYRLRPGHYLRVTAAGIAERPYWQPDFDKRLILKSDDDYVQAFKELFHQVVHTQLRSQNSISAFLSGGLDSSSVAVEAAGILRESGKRLATFTHVPRPGFNGPVPKGRYADESDRVKQIAALHDNIDVNLLFPSEDETLIDDADHFFDFMEAPLRNTANRLWISDILREQQKRGVNVILTGEMGNYTFTWNGYQALPHQLIQGNLGWVLKEALAIGQSQNRSPWKVFVGQALLPLMPRIRWMLRYSWRNMLIPTSPWRNHSAIHPDFAKKMFVAHRAAATGHDFYHAPPINPRKACWYGVMAAGHLADLQAGAKAQFGVEQRNPAIDRRLVEFCLSLPEEQFLKNGMDRRLVKRAFATRLPADILYGTKKGLQSPDWFEHLTRHKQQLEEEVKHLAKHPLANRYLDIDRLQHLIQHWPEQGWETKPVMQQYRQLLSRGIMLGRFLRWFEESNSRLKLSDYHHYPNTPTESSMHGVR